MLAKTIPTERMTMVVPIMRVRLLHDLLGIAQSLQSILTYLRLINDMRETRTPTENISSASRIVLRVAIIAKSDSSIYALALHKLGVEPEKAWHVVDRHRCCR